MGLAGKSVDMTCNSGCEPQEHGAKIALLLGADVPDVPAARSGLQSTVPLHHHQPFAVQFSAAGRATRYVRSLQPCQHAPLDKGYGTSLLRDTEVPQEATQGDDESGTVAGILCKPVG